jgi:lactoylglutathione lyase
MHINHVAIWVRDLEAMKEFYCRSFGGTANAKYENPDKWFKSYFITFENGARLELMHIISRNKISMYADTIGLAHLAFSVGSKEAVDALTETLRKTVCTVASNVRTTGDGYYESVVSDPEGNLIEITV